MRFFLALAISILSLSSFAETSIYLSSGKNFDNTEVEYAMNEIFANGEVKNINIFIHGRGKHPEKGFGVMSDIEKTYGVKSLMFHWSSWKSVVERPVGSAISSAEGLSKFLIGINRYVRRHPLRMANVNLTVLVHSMGNIVFKEMMDDYYQPGDFKENLFSSVVFNAADVPSKGHKQWLDRIDFSKNNYITFNDNDIVLYGSEKLDKFNNDYEEYEGPRLGKDLVKVYRKKGYSLSTNAKYLNISKLTYTGHRHFIVDDKEKNAEMKSIFSRIMTGKTPYLTSRDGMYKFKDLIYYFKRN